MTYSLYETDNATGPRNIIVLSTTAGMRLNAVWKQKKDRWYIVEPGNERNLNNVVDILTPRQFQGAIENGKYFFKW
jgi:hypothetical protein